MKKRLLGGVALLALTAASAAAADLPARVQRAPGPVPVVYEYNWSGFYIGGHGGGAWGEKCFTFVGVGDGCHNVSGGLAGGQVGFNWQTGNLVLGVEFSGSATWLDGRHTIPGSIGGDTFDTRVDSLFLLTARAGYAFDRLLLYVTGGGASVRDRYTFVDNPLGIASSARETRWGWTIGAGLEYAFAPSWSVGAQYNYVGLGTRDVSFTTFTESIRQDLHVATLRLNYRFGGGPVTARY
jgi:outer membrane immunogenic protein